MLPLPILGSDGGELRDRSKSQALVLGNLSLAHIWQDKVNDAVAMLPGSRLSGAVGARDGDVHHIAAHGDPDAALGLRRVRDGQLPAVPRPPSAIYAGPDTVTSSTEPAAKKTSIGTPPPPVTFVREPKKPLLAKGKSPVSVRACVNLLKDSRVRRVTLAAVLGLVTLSDAFVFVVYSQKFRSAMVNRCPPTVVVNSSIGQ
jgi:hypothetical protein